MSLILPSCLENIIGLSEVDCECFTGAPADASTSLSSLYLDKLEGLDLKMIEAAADCESGSLWQMMYDAREQAIIQFKGDLFAGLHSHYAPRYRQFSGPMGEAKFRNNITLNSLYAGTSVIPRPMRGGVMRVKRIGAMFSGTGPLIVSVFDSNDYNPIATITASAVQNKLTWTTISGGLDLPMTDEAGDYIRYDFLYETDTAPGAPKDAKISCGCGGRKVYWNAAQPRFEESQSAKRWEVFAMVSGATGNDTSTTTLRDNFGRNTTYLNGIILDVEFRCSVNDVLCQAVSDFENGLIAVNIAVAIRYLAGYILADKILSTNQVNYYTMSDRERLMGKKNSWVKDYQARLLEDIIPQFPMEANDCLICNNENGPRKTGILS